jgi:hypothetical protein
VLYLVNYFFELLGEVCSRALVRFSSSFSHRILLAVIARRAGEVAMQYITIRQL